MPSYRELKSFISLAKMWEKRCFYTMLTGLHMFLEASGKQFSNEHEHH